MLSFELRDARSSIRGTVVSMGKALCMYVQNRVRMNQLLVIIVQPAEDLGKAGRRREQRLSDRSDIARCKPSVDLEVGSSYVTAIV